MNGPTDLCAERLEEKKTLFTAAFVALTVVIALSDVNLTVVMIFKGAICGVALCYLVPGVVILDRFKIWNTVLRTPSTPKRGPHFLRGLKFQKMGKICFSRLQKVLMFCTKFAMIS